MSDRRWYELRCLIREWTPIGSFGMGEGMRLVRELEELYAEALRREVAANGT